MALGDLFGGDARSNTILFGLLAILVMLGLLQKDVVVGVSCSGAVILVILLAAFVIGRRNDSRDAELLAFAKENGWPFKAASNERGAEDMQESFAELKARAPSYTPIGSLKNYTSGFWQGHRFSAGYFHDSGGSRFSIDPVRFFALTQIIQPRPLCVRVSRGRMREEMEKCLGVVQETKISVPEFDGPFTIVTDDAVRVRRFLSPAVREKISELLSLGFPAVTLRAGIVYIDKRAGVVGQEDLRQIAGALRVIADGAGRS